MTQNEFYEKIAGMGKDVYASESIAIVNGDVFYNYFTLHVDGAKVSSASSRESAIEQIEKMDPKKIKADRVAELKAEISRLEVS